METTTSNFVSQIGAQSSVRNAAKVIGFATLVSGTLDAIAAVVVFVFVLGKTSIMGVLQLIASGVYGQVEFAIIR